MENLLLSSLSHPLIIGKYFLKTDVHFLTLDGNREKSFFFLKTLLYNSQRCAKTELSTSFSVINTGRKQANHNRKIEEQAVFTVYKFVYSADSFGQNVSLVSEIKQLN